MKRTLIILGIVVALVILPFSIDRGGEYNGSDGETGNRAQAIAPHHGPQFQPLYEPASGKIESLLFTLQGSLGAAMIFYILSYTEGRQRRNDRV